MFEILDIVDGQIILHGGGADEFELTEDDIGCWMMAGEDGAMYIVHFEDAEFPNGPTKLTVVQ